MTYRDGQLPRKILKSLVKGEQQAVSVHEITFSLETVPPSSSLLLAHRSPLCCRTTGQTAKPGYLCRQRLWAILGFLFFSLFLGLWYFPCWTCLTSRERKLGWIIMSWCEVARDKASVLDTETSFWPAESSSKWLHRTKAVQATILIALDIRFFILLCIWSQPSM